MLDAPSKRRLRVDVLRREFQKSQEVRDRIPSLFHFCIRLHQARNFIAPTAGGRNPMADPSPRVMETRGALLALVDAIEAAWAGVIFGLALTVAVESFAAALVSNSNSRRSSLSII